MIQTYLILMNIKKDILWRVYLVYIVICLGGAMILFKAVQIRYFETLKDGRSWVEYDRGKKDETRTSY